MPAFSEGGFELGLLISWFLGEWGLVLGSGLRLKRKEALVAAVDAVSAPANEESALIPGYLSGFYCLQYRERNENAGVIVWTRFIIFADDLDDRFFGWIKSFHLIVCYCLFLALRRIRIAHSLDSSTRSKFVRFAGALPPRGRPPTSEIH